MFDSKKRNELIGTSLFTVLILLFLCLAFLNDSFFDWAYARHQNQLSWYIRPLFILPFCFFSYKKSLSGIAGTVFLLLTSMFWFSKPEVVGENAKQFLDMEKAWLTGEWTFAKIAMTLIVPVSLIILSAAFWKRNLWFGLSVVIFIAIAKMVWSVAFGGDSGKSIFIPAITGLIICCAFILLGAGRIRKKRIYDGNESEKS